MAKLIQLESPVPTPYATICVGDREIGHGGCGIVYMTKELYNAQMMAPDCTWRCARCRMEAQWDDDNYESFFEQEETG